MNEYVQLMNVCIVHMYVNVYFFLFQCAARGYRNVLLEAGLTKCGEIVLVNRTTLDRAGLVGGASSYKLDELRKLNITELHPLG